MTENSILYAYGRTDSGGHRSWKSYDGEPGDPRWILQTTHSSLPEDYDLAYMQTSAMVPFVTWEALTAFAKERFGVTGWKRESNSGRYFPHPTANDVPCGLHYTIDHGRWSSFTVCNRRRKDGADQCGLHLAAAKRREDKVAKAREIRQRSEEGSRIAEDAIEALATRGIDADRHYHAARHYEDSGYTGKVTIHAEDVLALLRKLARAEEMLGADLEVDD